MLFHVTGELSGLEIGFIVVLAVVLVVVLAAVLGGSCGAAARRIVRQRVHMDDAVNLPVPDPQDERELEMPDAQDEWEVPPGEADTLPYYSSPVQERARGTSYQLTNCHGNFTVITQAAFVPATFKHKL